MVKKRRKRLKIGFLLFFLFLVALVICLLTFGFDSLINTKIKNIYVTGNNTVSDKEIIELGKLENYPKILSISSDSIKRRIKMNPYIKEVKVRKALGNIVYIGVTEYKILFYDGINKKVVLESNKQISDENKFNNIPILSTTIDDEKIYKKLTDKFVLIDESIKDKISEIIYSKTSVDNERFIFYMNDGNEVYITLTKIESVNEYLEYLELFENKKGRIYLDAGKYFEEYK